MLNLTRFSDNYTEYFRHLSLKQKRILILGVVCLVFLLIFYILPEIFSLRYDASHMRADVGGANITMATSSEPAVDILPPVIHIKTPEPLKAVYISSWVAGTGKLMDNILKMVDDTELNAVVIDVKDSTGQISFKTRNAEIDGYGCNENRIRDIDDLIKRLHDKNIYIIARISVFEDPCLSVVKPEWAVKRKSTGLLWKDRKGLGWLDPGTKDVWKYNVELAKTAYALGFDEINFDYIRFPSDGNMEDILLPNSSKYSATTTKVQILENFFKYISSELRVVKEVDGNNQPAIPISADVFGMVATNNDDLGIGQLLETILPNVDYLAPMVYPSHFPPHWNGLLNPASEPYKVISWSMDKARLRAVAIGENPLKLRPWLQDFNLGATYTKEKVRAQIQATYDIGLTSWMLWDANNSYTESALLRYNN